MEAFKENLPEGDAILTLIEEWDASLPPEGQLNDAWRDALATVASNEEVTIIRIAHSVIREAFRL